MRARMRALPATLLSIVVWLVVAFGLWSLAGGRHDTPISFSPSSLREGRWYEYVIRFALGGTATVFTGFISSRYGASVGGLFLALPAIFCASATLIESTKSAASGRPGLAGERGEDEQAAALDAAGAVLGALGMLAFAFVFWLLVERSVSGAFAAASLAWLAVSVAAWFARRKAGVHASAARESGRPAMSRSRPSEVCTAVRPRRGFGVDALAQRYRVELRVRRLLLV